MFEQLKFNKVKPRTEAVLKVIKKGKNFVVKTNKKKYNTKTIILATGARPRKLGVPGEERLEKKGVTYCSICDGPVFQGLDVAIVGGGNSALEAVDFMKNIARKIYLINISDKFIGHEYLIDKVKKNKKVRVINNAKTAEILGEKFVTGLKYIQNNVEKKIKVGGVIIEIGRVPNTEFVKDFIKFDKDKHILVNCDTSTSVEGVFAAGDCSSIHEYQYVIAAGTACIALLKASRYLAGRK